MKHNFHKAAVNFDFKRQECLDLLVELKKWGIVPFSKDRRNLTNTIKFSYNQKRLDYVHTRLTNMLDNVMMKKLSEGL